MTYEKAMEFIGATARFGSRPGLSRITEFMARLGDPQKRLRFVHIAGTNGKGSTAAMTASILRAAGVRTGLYISPYVEDFRERIQIDGSYIGKRELARLTEHIAPVVRDMERDGFESPTEFELVTALALLYYAEKGCGAVVLEVGLGGRFDATNVIGPPETAVITKISLDHTAVLGDTISKIAFEKCGIIKPGTGAAVVYPHQPEEALSVIEKACRERGVKLILPDESRLEALQSGLCGTDIEYRGMRLRVPLVGEHQIFNAITAAEAVLSLNTRGFDINEDTISAGIAAAAIPGRLEIMREDPLCIRDSAHNPDGVDALCAALDRYLAGGRIITVMGMFADKDYDYCIPHVAEKSAAFIAVKPPSPRALGSEKAAELAKTRCPEVYDKGERLGEAVGLAIHLAGEDGVVLACGSLSFIGEFKKLILKRVSR